MVFSLFFTPKVALGTSISAQLLHTMKITFTLPLFLFSLALSAQSQSPQLFDPNTAPEASPASVVRGGGTIYWDEDFANGLSSTNGLWTQEGADTIWKHSLFTTSGEWSTGTPEFQGPTEANGFMLFDADSVNFPISPNYLDRSGSIVSPYIDLTGASEVLLEFNQQFRGCCTSFVIIASVSVDSGATWNDFDVSGGLSPSVASANPDHITLNINALVANEPAVLLKFSFGGPGITHYYYIIDDVQLVQGQAYEPQITDAYFDDYAEYYIYTSWTQTQPLEFSATIENLGTDTLRNAMLQVDVYDNNGMLEHTETSAPQDILGATYVEGQNAYLPNWGPSTYYDIVFKITHDSIALQASSDSIVRRIWQAPNEQARDNGEQVGTIFNGGASYECGNIFNMQSFANIECINYYVDSLTVVGSPVYGVAYLYDSVSGTHLYIEQTNDYIIQQGDIGNWQVLQFQQPIFASQGELWNCVVGSYGLDTLVLGTSTNTPRPFTSFFFDGNDNTWNYLAETPMVRIAFGATHSVAENDADALEMQVYPNPAEALTTVSCKVEESGPLLVELFDTRGRLVYHEQFDAWQGKQFTTEIKTDGLAAGLYHVQLTSSHSMATQQLTVK